MFHTPPAPELEYLARFHVEVATPVEVGNTPDGFRRIIPITGGTVDGPHFRGRILDAGADFQLVASDTVALLDARYVVETSDGERLYIVNDAIRSASLEDTAALLAGQPVPAERVYFKCHPKISTAAARYQWLSEHLIIGSGERRPDAVILDLWVVR
ncbi:DUF3237 domain-containing protein [Micrococcoides hystricis]|uniref:UPF0311 protein ACFFFR_05390 n=1 Tax=Micrococcoides hystricis TaxID=1572761 RepID=A0ABV6P9L7_9MICC